MPEKTNIAIPGKRDAPSPKEKGVTIPLSLLHQTIELLEYIDMSKYDQALKDSYDAVLYSYLEKRHRIELRESYSKIVCAKDEGTRFEARMKYLSHKRLSTP